MALETHFEKKKGEERKSVGKESRNDRKYLLNCIQYYVCTKLATLKCSSIFEPLAQPTSSAQLI